MIYAKGKTAGLNHDYNNNCNLQPHKTHCIEPCWNAANSLIFNAFKTKNYKKKEWSTPAVCKLTQVSYSYTLVGIYIQQHRTKLLLPLHATQKIKIYKKKKIRIVLKTSQRISSTVKRLMLMQSFRLGP